MKTGNILMDFSGIDNSFENLKKEGFFTFFCRFLSGQQLPVPGFQVQAFRHKIEICRIIR